ncbi:MAG: alpha/beta fold hydrolase [Dehalococcoidia bacterium]|nr:alpha/beta fold hydrolase [Dehalococcoidia bacterium]
MPSDGCAAPWYQVHEGHGPHVLLVHGWLSARSHWLPNLRALREYATPVVVELYGHGRSPAPADPACYHPDAYVEQFERIRQEVGAERWMLVGQSLGAALTLRYALEHPERVIAQAFTNSASAFAPPEWVERIRGSMTSLAERIEREGPADPSENRMSPHRNRRVSAEVRAALHEDVLNHSAIGVARTSMWTLPYTSLYERIDENRVPALLVVGEREDGFAEQARFIEGRLPCVEVARLDGGHGVNLDVPDAFDAALRAFFTRFIQT